MSKNKASISHGKTYKEIGEFWDTHDLGDFWDKTKEADFEVDLKHDKYLFSLDEETVGKLTEIAKKKRTSSHKLIERWLKEKIKEAV
jgi:predicted transcriptional regulator